MNTKTKNKRFLVAMSHESWSLKNQMTTFLTQILKDQKILTSLKTLSRRKTLSSKIGKTES